MVGVGWNFPVLSGGGEEGYTSNDIEAFKGEELYINLTRETCQNSLDAKEQDSEEPVIVKYELRELNVATHSFFAQYFECLKNCEEYWSARADGIPERLDQLLTKARRTIEAGTVKVLVVSDYNTPGLLGSETMTGSFNALVYADGVSYKGSDTSAGSFGIGRNAPFACSALSCVCYNTKATDGGQAFAGIAKLATTLNKDGKRTRKQGRYQYNDDEREDWRAIRPSDNDEFAKLFSRDEYGTDVIILGFEASDDWQKQLESAVLKNFFLAIHERKLVVEIQGKVIDSETISAAFTDYADDQDMKLAHQYYKAIVDANSVHCDLNILSDGDAELYIRTDAEIDTLKNVAWFRSSGMLIRSFRPQGIFRPYVAVFVAKGDLDRILRDTEPARHNDWDFERIEKGADERKLAREAITKLKREIKAHLKETCESVIDDTVDAIGAADYLPDSMDGNPNEGGGSDILRPLIRIGKARRSVPSDPVEKVRGKKSTGKAVPGEVRNHRVHPIGPEPKPEPTTPVADDGEKQGVVPGRGGKTIVRPVDGQRRIFAISAEQGIYRLVIVPGETAERVYASCSVLGENGTNDPIKVKAAMLNGRHIGITPDKTGIGPFNVNQDNRITLEVTFEERGSMALAVELNSKGGKR